MQDEVMNAWAAGLFEGEGTFWLNPRTGYVGCAISMTDLDVLEKFAAIMGGKCRPVRVNREKYGQFKPVYRWGSSGRPAGEVIRRMLPYLCERRAAKARECLAALDQRYQPRPCPRCQAEFVPVRSDQKYCTARCTQSANAKRRYWEDPERYREVARDWQRAHREVKPCLAVQSAVAPQPSS